MKMDYRHSNIYNKVYGAIRTTFAMLCLLLTTACSSENDFFEEGIPTNPEADQVNVALSFSIPKSAGPASSRMTADIVQADNTQPLRQLQDIYLIPFSKRGKITATDNRSWNFINLSDSNGTYADGVTSYAHPYWYIEQLYVPLHTSSFLFYGRAAQANNATKFTNGSLIAYPSILEGSENPAAIHFDPDPIYTATDATVQEDILAYLTSIANVSYTVENVYLERYSSGNRYYWRNQGNKTYTWNNASFSDASLNNLYKALTNNNDPYAGASKAIEVLLSNLYYSVTNYNSTDNTREYSTTTSDNNAVSRSVVLNALRDAIRAAIENSTYVTCSGAGTTNARVTFKAPYKDFPHADLPEGSGAVQWEGSHFISQTDDETVNIPSINRYCYPAELYYMANTQIYASKENNRREQYAPSNIQWNTFVTTNYELANARVEGDTKAVALIDEVQYAVGQLEAKVVAQTASLVDSDNQRITLSSANFRLTGIIIGQQRSVDFNFEPLASAELDYYAYDKTENMNYNLSTTISGANYTLALQTIPNQRVGVLLEFENGSGNSFNGADGRTIFPGMKFYLATLLDPTKADNYNTELSNGDLLREVFHKDRITKVTFSIASLKEAYNTIPEVTDPHLSLGVVVDMDWVEATPKRKILY